jgi:hypothetical protein
MTMESANKGAAIAAVTSPWWLPPLQSVSEVAGLILPIAGVFWIIIQITIKLYQFKHRK